MADSNGSQDPPQQQPVNSSPKTGKESVHCSFCSVSAADARKIIGGPTHLYICDGCVALAVTADSQGSASNDRVLLHRSPVDTEVERFKDLADEMHKLLERMNNLLTRVEKEIERCDFCDMGFRALVRASQGPYVKICRECLDLCEEILIEEFEERGENSSPDV